MKLLIAIDGHFQSYNSDVYSSHLNYDTYWRPFLDVFDQVLVAARVKTTENIPVNWGKVTGDGINFCKLPEYRGPRQYLSVKKEIKEKLQQAILDTDAFLLCLPGMIGTMVWKQLPREDPFGVQVVTDPYDQLAPGTYQHLLRPFIRQWWTGLLRRQCASAAAVTYVTEGILQKRYPPAKRAFTNHYSNVYLSSADIISEPKTFRRGLSSRTLIYVGRIDGFVKAPDNLIKALGQCVNKGLDLRLVLVGGGQSRKLKSLAVDLGLEECVSFRGELPGGEAVREELDQASIFILPSRAEGLPRAIIEAMARGLPCIGSSVGGIPELLIPEDTVPPGNVEALAEKIIEVADNPERLSEMSARNLKKAREFHHDLMREKKAAFLGELRKKSERWNKK